MINPETLEELPLLTIMVGLQGSGKSTKVKELADKNTIVLSSDNYRLENPLWDNEKVFKQLYTDMNKFLKLGLNVIIDATNITIKSRRRIFSNLREKCIKKCYIMNTPYDICKQRVEERNKSNVSHQVPLEVLQKYLHSFEIPFYEEGFDYIQIDIIPKQQDAIAYQNEVMLLSTKFDQQNKHHTKNLYNHMKDVSDKLKSLSAIRSAHKGQDLILQWSGYYHDIGKLFTQTFKEGDPNAHYYNHANVGAYYLLCRCGIYIIGLDKEVYSHKMTLDWLFYINYHMHMYNITSEKSIRKWKNIFGEFKYHQLETLNQADRAEHL